jgi:hypothetical protein
MQLLDVEVELRRACAAHERCEKALSDARRVYVERVDQDPKARAARDAWRAAKRAQSPGTPWEDFERELVACADAWEAFVFLQLAISRSSWASTRVRRLEELRARAESAPPTIPAPPPRPHADAAAAVFASASGAT